jgi:hypothetical protein
MINSYVLNQSGDSQVILGKQFVIENSGKGVATISFASSGDSFDLPEGDKLKIGSFATDLSDTLTVTFPSIIGIYNELKVVQLA